MIKSKFAFRTFAIATGIGGALLLSAGAAAAYTIDDYNYWRSVVITDNQLITDQQSDIDATNLRYSDWIATCNSHGWDSTTVEECQEGFQVEWDGVAADQQAHMSDLQAQFNSDHAQYVIVANDVGMPL